MAVGDIVGDLQSVDSGDYLTIRPSGTTKVEVSTIFFNGPSSLWFSDAINSCLIATYLGSGRWSGIKTHVNNDYFLKILNTAATAHLIGYTGIEVGAFPLAPHKESHQNAGSDEISVLGLSGLLADPQTPNELGEGHISIIPWAYGAVTQGTWVLARVTLQVINGWFTNSSNAINDQIDYYAYLAVGTYTLVLLHATSSDGGIITILLDTVSKGTIDCYSASVTYNLVNSTISFAVTTPGLKTLSFNMATKNVSSSGYKTWLSTISLFRTA